MDMGTVHEHRRKEKKYQHKERKYYIIIFVVIIAYWIASYLLPLDEYTKRITTTTTLIAAVVLWLQMKRGERLNESNFIMNLNNQFVSNKDMTLVEHELEQCFNQYTVLLEEDGDVSLEDLKQLRLGLSSSRTSEDCQKLINYLVYLEALSALVSRRILHLDVIDDLFSYRFFIAVNNPIVQQNELHPYKPYYEGIYKLSEEWTKKHNEWKIPIPMYQYDLNKTYKEYCENGGKKIIDYDISFATSKDRKQEIAKCIYGVDPLIYPEAFGEDPELAVKAITRIIGMDDSLFDYKNLFVARYCGEVCGVCVLNPGDAQWDTDAIRKRIGTQYLPENQEEAYRFTSAHYFQDECDQRKALSDTVKLVAFCVEAGFRRKGIGQAMLSKLIETYKDRSIRLTVLQDNKAAIALYEKMGFKQEGEAEPGFAAKGLARPNCIRMVRKPQA